MLGAPLASDILEDQGRNIEKSSLFTPIRKTGVCAVFGVLIFTSLAAFFVPHLSTRILLKQEGATNTKDRIKIHTAATSMAKNIS